MTLDRTPASGASDADPVEQREEAVGVAEPAHPAQHRRARVLEREVVVGSHARRGRDRLEEPGAELGRLQVGHPDPLDPVHRCQLGQQRLQEVEVAEVLAVGRGVLADQEQLAGALVGQPAGLGQHVGRPAADERAAEARDRAERAAPVAAAGQLERRGRVRDRGGGVRMRGRRRDRAPARSRAPARPARSAAACDGPAACAAGAPPRRRSSAGARRCRGSRRSRARRRPRAASRRAPCRTARPGSRPRPRPGCGRSP